MRIDADDLDWAASALGVVGADFTVLSPPELGPYLDRLARRCAAASAVLPGAASGAR